MGCNVTGPTSKNPNPNWDNALSPFWCISKPAANPTGLGKETPITFLPNCFGGSMCPITLITAGPIGSFANVPIAVNVSSLANEAGIRNNMGRKSVWYDQSGIFPTSNFLDLVQSVFSYLIIPNISIIFIKKKVNSYE
jgi:hypothetical protein